MISGLLDLKWVKTMPSGWQTFHNDWHVNVLGLHRRELVYVLVPTPSDHIMGRSCNSHWKIHWRRFFSPSENRWPRHAPRPMKRVTGLHSQCPHTVISAAPTVILRRPRTKWHHPNRSAARDAFKGARIAFSPRPMNRYIILKMLSEYIRTVPRASSKLLQRIVQTAMNHFIIFCLASIHFALLAARFLKTCFMLFMLRALTNSCVTTTNKRSSRVLNHDLTLVTHRHMQILTCHQSLHNQLKDANTTSARAWTQEKLNTS